jgi:hypothetical protein
LFEAMTKAPQVQHPPRRGGLFSRRRHRDGGAAVPVVAEALTEEEAAAELEAQAAAEEREKAKAARRAAKKAKKEAKATPAGFETEPADLRPVRLVRGRLVVSLNTVSCIVGTAAVCVLMLTAYSLGRKSMQSSSAGLQPAAAISKAPGLSGSPLLPQPGATKPAVSPRRNAEADSDLSRLLQVPPSRRESGVAANVPAKAQSEVLTEEAGADHLNYLQVESFLITRDRNGDVVAGDLADVRRFLAEHGIETIARRHSNGFVLYSRQGFPMGREHAEAREAFRTKVESLGEEYRRGGGLYSFKGCMFVSYAQTRAGRPV